MATAAAEGEDHAGLVGALDAAMGTLSEADDLLSFLPNLSYQSSLLKPDQLASWVRALDAVDPAAVRGSHVRAAFALDPDAPCLPAEGAPRLLRRSSRRRPRRCPRGSRRPTSPARRARGRSSAFARVLPDVTMRAQFGEFSHMLAAAMVRAVELRGARETRGGPREPPRGARCAFDQFADWKAPRWRRYPLQRRDG